MSEEKKSQIRKKVTAVEIALAAVLVIYVIYGIVTKSSNNTIFNALAIFIVAAYVVLNDFVEPYLTEVFVNMNDFRKDSYKKYLMWDVASMAGLLLFVLNFSQDGSMMLYIGLAMYFVGSKQKRPYMSAYLGDVTEEDVEAAKAAVSEEEKSQEVTETVEE